jgi:hypothetical protein
MRQQWRNGYCRRGRIGFQPAGAPIRGTGADRRRGRDPCGGSKAAQQIRVAGLGNRQGTERADERLQTVLGHLAEMGREAAGMVGADNSLLAFEDAIRDFTPDHLLVALRAGEDAGWQERGLLEQLQQRFGLPITVILERLAGTRGSAPRDVC